MGGTESRELVGCRREGDSGSASWLALFTVSHVVLGSFTLAATVWMAIEIRKYVRPGVTAALDSRGQADATAKLETGLN